MDLNAILGALLSSESIAGVSANTGATENQVKSILGSALPMLLSGANAQAQDTASGFAGALKQHAASDTSNIAAFLSGVDLEDGAKIVAHLLGAKSDEQTQSFAERAGVSAAKSGSILANAAPLLMSLLGKQTAAESSGNDDAIGGLLSGLLGKADVSSLASSFLGVSAAPSGSSSGKEKKGGILDFFMNLLK